MKSLLGVLLFAASVACVHAQEKVDLSAIEKIRKEGLEKSKVMDMAFYLTDVNGPRLSNSPGLRKAEAWAAKTLKEMGLSNVNLEPWGEFGQGWEIERSYVALKSPYYQALIATPKAWSGSTNGEIRAEVVVIEADTNAIKKMGSSLAGKIVAFETKESLEPTFKPDGTRFTDEDLQKLESLPVAKKANPEVVAKQRALKERIRELLYQQKVALIISITKGSHGTLFTTGGTSYKMNSQPTPAELEMAPEDYLRIIRLVKAGQKVELEADVRTRFYKEDPKAYNVIAEIPGTDKKLKSEVVMLGAHLDSWHGSTGATDNAAGCAIMMEAVRILKAQNLQPRRTIRIALWSSEEQGLWGSKGYVANHFGTASSPGPAQKKISAYYNFDNGAGKIRGVYLQENTAVKPIFEEWLKPFYDLGATALPNRNTGSTDHVSFDAVGIPGFQFIQDRLEYGTRTHHSNQDSYDRLIEADLKQAATIIASFVYHTAQRNELLPRKPLKGAQ